MTLKKPFIISSRLLPALKIGNATVQLEYSKRPGAGGRTRYQWIIDIQTDTGEQTFTGHDLQSGCQGGSLQEGFESLLSFLGAAAESLSYTRRTGRETDNADLFPAAVAAWADQNSDEISLAEMEVRETADLITE